MLLQINQVSTLKTTKIMCQWDLQIMKRYKQNMELIEVTNKLKSLAWMVVIFLNYHPIDKEVLLGKDLKVLLVDLIHMMKFNKNLIDLALNLVTQNTWK